MTMRIFFFSSTNLYWWSLLYKQKVEVINPVKLKPIKIEIEKHNFKFNNMNVDLETALYNYGLIYKSIKFKTD